MNQKTDEDKFELKSRKAQHVKIVIDENVGVDKVTNGFELFDIIPRSVPDINYSDINMNAEFLGHTFDHPIMVAGMTGGYREAKQINEKLAGICSRLNIPMGLGSQRAMIVNPETTDTFNVKASVPDVFLVGNLGLVQFCMDFDLSEYDLAVEGINADAMAIHVNAFQELCQPEGDVNFKGAWDEFEKISRHSKIPVIGKEVGAGIPYEDVVKMEKLGASAVDIGGAGGTSWAKIELLRHDNERPYELDDPTLRVGIPTAFATYEATAKSDIPIISTGGMYNGLMAFKALAMGSSMVGIARPVLTTLINHGEEAAEQWLLQYSESIKRLMFLMGVDSINQLRQEKSRLVPTGRAREWLSHRKMV